MICKCIITKKFKENFLMATSRAQLPKTTDKKRGKISKVMREYKSGKLKSGKSNKKVVSRKNIRREKKRGG